MSTEEKKLPQPPAGEAKQESKNRIRAMFLGLVIVMLMSSLNQTILAPSLPTIVGELHGVEHMSWVITIFILLSTITMPVYGKLSDQFGRKPFLIFAIVSFMAGSVVGALAQDMNWLIFARALQGLGGGGLMILSQAVIADVIPPRDRGRYMGIIGGVFAFSSVAGPLIGGWITEGPGWRWAFWLNLPLAVLSILAVIFLLPHRPFRDREKHNIDYLGSLILMAGTSALVLATIWGGNQYEWTSPEIIGLLVFSVVAALVFIPVENRAAEPVMPMYLFKNRNFVLTLGASLALGVAMFGAVEYIPTYLQMALGVSATVAGLLMIPMMGVMLVVSIVTGRLVSKTGRYKGYVTSGTAIVALGLFLLSTVTIDTPTWLFCVYLGVMGAGLGMSMQFLTLIVQNAFPVSVVGTATAANNFFRQVGATVGASLVGGLFTSRLTSLISERMPQQALQSSGGHASSSLTPELVASLPEPVHGIIVNAYNDALIPLFLYLVPLALVSTLLLFFIREDALATTLETEPAVDVARAATGAIPVITPEMATKDAQALKSMQGSARTRIDESLSSEASPEPGSQENGGAQRP
ncbi:MDR family MFS transporter [Rothia sp. HMSC068F09]|uniref:MDR family MFS transporter n=1 Tax=Rothia sp. HMSC068F09 TaxID=1739378 RepID=UPI0008A101E7|nr:MDR family MFS transporter [Rothia sp. HMSC068F09]OFR67083.1 MFS transporter [Rothia sp. HMSC068F09]